MPPVFDHCFFWEGECMSVCLCVDIYGCLCERVSIHCDTNKYMPRDDLYASGV
jgi:hypothetical protein